MTGLFPAAPARSFPRRMIGAALLDVTVFEEVADDRRATAQAALVVLLAGAAGAVRYFPGDPLELLTLAVASLSGWLVWTAVSYLVGRWLLGGRPEPWALLRALGFSHAPGVLYLLALAPWLIIPVHMVIGMWMMAASVAALRQALDLDTGKAILTTIIGWTVYVVPFILTVWKVFAASR